jgi:hypothetical protein
MGWGLPAMTDVRNRLVNFECGDRPQIALRKIDERSESTDYERFIDRNGRIA